MAQVDTSIYSAFLQPPKTVADYTAQADARDANRLQLLLQQGAAADQMVARDRQRNLLRLMQGLPGTATDEDRINALRGGAYFNEADQLQKGILDRQKTNADVGKIGAETAGMTQKQAIDLHNQHLQALSSVTDVPGMQQWLSDGVKNGTLSMQNATALSSQLAADPTQLKPAIQRLQGMGVDLAKQLEMRTAKPTEVRAGDRVEFLDTNPNSPTYGQKVTPAVKVGVSPDTVANNATSRANNAANIIKDLQVAGMQPGGGLDDNSERTAQAIASGQLPAPTGMALLNPKNQRILGRVMEINPEYDSTTVDAKKKAARDFTSGPLGNAMRSFNVAGQHLDQLGELVDALGNGNTQLVNKLGNAFREQTGNAAPTNFDAAKDVVSKEVVKAIVAGGGGVAERQELSELMSKAKSPAQLKGVIAQYRGLMAAQHDALLQQRRAAGLPDSTLPNYAEPSGGGKPSAKPAPIAPGSVLKFDANGQLVQ